MKCPKCPKLHRYELTILTHFKEVYPNKMAYCVRCDLILISFDGELIENERKAELLVERGITALESRTRALR